MITHETYSINIVMTYFLYSTMLTSENPFIDICIFSSEFLTPYKPRPETTASVARNLVAGALGLTSRVNREKQREDRLKLKQAKG